MVAYQRIDEPTDPRVADYVGLTDVARRTRAEPEQGIFLAEGELVMRRAARAGYRIRSMLLSPERLALLDPELRGLDCPRYVASDEVLRAVTGFEMHRGAIASYARRPLPAPAEVSAAARRLVVLEDVNNHTNLGAVFRSAAGLGMDAVLLSPTCCDPLYRRAVRVSMGEVFAVPYAYADAWPDALARLQHEGFRLLALTPSPDAVALDRLTIAPDERVALLLGAEGRGLSDDALSSSDTRVGIPMSNGVDSLNVAAAAAVACWVVGRRTVEA